MLVSAELGFVRMPELDHCWSLQQTTVQLTAVTVCVKWDSYADLMHLTLSMKILLKWAATVTKLNRSAYPFTPTHLESDTNQPIVTKDWDISPAPSTVL